MKFNLEDIKNKNKVLRNILSYIERFSLDLKGYKVLTEAGTNLYNYTPLIPILSGADKVMVWTRDSEHGKADQIINNLKSLFFELSIDPKIEFYNGVLNINHLSNADLITNSGFIRPLNIEKLKYIKKDSVIPLMFEKWEMREADIDIQFCRKKGIKVAGTNESQKDLNIFNYVGLLAIKMVFEAGYEIMNNNIVIWSNDSFGKVILKSFELLKPKNIVLTNDFNNLQSEAKNIDFIFLADYHERRVYTSGSFFSFKTLKEKNPFFGVVHLYGKLEFQSVIQDGIDIYPKKNGESMRMSFSLSHLGINPWSALQVASFKVGQLLLNKNSNDDLIQEVC